MSNGITERLLNCSHCIEYAQLYTGEIIYLRGMITTTVNRRYTLHKQESKPGKHSDTQVKYAPPS